MKIAVSALLAVLVAVVVSGQPAFGRGGTRQASVAVDASRTIRTVDSRVFGINTAVWDGNLANGSAAPLVRPLDLRIMRFPGGSLSDEYHWKTNMSQGQTFTWASGFDAFMATVDAVESSAMITVNYGTGSPEEAAEWVEYANVTKGYGVRYWEIGNECYGNWERDDHESPNDPYTYATEAAAYITAMKAVDPTIEIGVVGLEGEDNAFVRYTNHPARNPRTGVEHTGWTPVMLTRLRELGVTPDFVVFHWYAQNPGPESDASLLQASDRWAGFAADLRQQLADYLGANGAGVELLVTENNSVSFNPGKQTTSLVNALYYADSVGQVLQTEFNALVWWDLSNGPLTTNNNSKSLYGWRKYGDYGIASPDLSQRYPTYYAMKLLASFARGGERVVRATSDDDLLACYAVQRENGSVALLVVNKSRTSAFNVTFDLAGFTPATTATVYAYGVAQDKAAKTGSGSPDVASRSLGVAGTRFTYKLAKYSMVVIDLPAA